MAPNNRFCFAAATAIVMLLSACASRLGEDEKLALAYEAAERGEEIRDFIRSCEGAGYVIVYTGRSYHKLRDPVERIPSHARLSDYACASAYYRN